MDSSSSSSSSVCCKRKAEDRLSPGAEKRRRLELRDQEVLTVKDVCDLIQYVTLRRSHSVKKPSWFGVGDGVSRVNLMILDGLTQSHFYTHFSLFTHLSSKYSTRWTLAPSSGDLLTSDLLSSEVTLSDRAAQTPAKIPAALMWHPVIRRFGLKRAGMSSFLLTQQEMAKHKFPVKGGRGCEGFVCSASVGPVTDHSPLFGLDCEMCVTCAGLEVTRVAVVDETGHCVLNELVKPHNPIIDYCTEFSGVTRAMLSCVSTRLQDVQCRLLQLLPPDAVLVGHSLDGDLRALQLIHTHVLDTSLLYRGEFGRRFKLKRLAQVILEREIQSEVRRGHDPCEDALAALHLAQYFIRRGPRAVVEEHLSDLWGVVLPEEDESDHETSRSPLHFGHALYKSGQSAVLLSRSTETSDVCKQQRRRHQCGGDREVVCVFRRVVQSYSLSVLQFCSFRDALSQTTAAGRRRHLQQECERLRLMCVLYVGPLPSDVTETLVHKLLQRCGRLRSVRLLPYTHQVHAEVVFAHPEGARLALEHLNELQLSGGTVQARRPVQDLSLDLDARLSERQLDPLNARSIYVCNLSSRPRRRDDQLHSFSRFGPIRSISAPEHDGTRRRHAFIQFECVDAAQAAVGVGLQTGGRTLWACPALTPPHMTSWTHTRPVAVETGAQQSEECDASIVTNESSPLESCDALECKIKKLDRRVGKVFRALEGNCLSVVILPGNRTDGVDHLGLCFIQIKQT